MSRFPAAFRLPALASWSSFARWGAGPSSRSAYRSLNLEPDPNGVVTLRTHEVRPGWVPSVPRGLRYPHGWRDSPPAARAAFQRPVPISVRIHNEIGKISPARFEAAYYRQFSPVELVSSQQDESP
jgi:hypothetical protein